MITGQWNPSEAMLESATAGLRQANKVSQLAAGALHVLSEAGGHLVDIGRGAAYSGLLDYGLVPGLRVPISELYDVSPQEFTSGAWGALAKRQGSQVSRGTYGARELGVDILQTEFAINPVTGSGWAGYSVGTGIYEGDAVAVGEGAAQLTLLAAPYRGVPIRGTASATAPIKNIQGVNNAIRVLSESEVKLYGRVSHPKGFRAEVWERAKAPDGNVYDPNGRIMRFDEPWELGHLPEHKFSQAQLRATSEGWSRQTWIRYQNDPDIYRPELPSSNAGHQWELPDTEWFK